MQWSSSAAVALLAAASAPAAVLSNDITSIHGSGTTNPSKCIWMHMSNFMDRAKLPLRLTYRAVGSSTGQKEFIGADNADVPYNYFGSGDIPISTANYDALTAKGIGIVQLPFVLGAISLFHNVPGVPEGPDGLNLTSCLISRIFKRDITVWDDPAIIAENPNLPDLLTKTNFPIKVAHRVQGSSSTSGVTTYLNAGCPSEWGTDLVGKAIDWPEDTMKCEGSGGMTDCIRDNEGAIGYIDAGHGWEEGLTEIELKNKDGNYISSRRAKMMGGIGDAAATIPATADLDFGGVDLVNKEGTYTWPIVAMSYVYVRKDLSFIDEPAEQSLLKAFLKNTLLDPTEIEKCSDKFGFTPVPESIRNVALAGLDMLEIDATAPEWTIETDTAAGVGQGDNVISKKRRSYAEYERSVLDGDEEGVSEGMIADLVKVAVQEHMDAVAAGDSPSAGGGDGTTQESNLRSDSAARQYTDSDASKLQAALVLSAISFSLWAVALTALVAKKMCGK